MRKNKKVFFVTLGCPKNTVDSENMGFLLSENGYEMVNTILEADIVVINTCGFILDAKEESVQAIMEAVQAKQENPSLQIVVSGCLAQRYPTDLAEEIPEIDYVVGTGEFYDIAGILTSDDQIHIRDINHPIVETGRVLSTPSHYAYLKISEGCDKHCTYCIIPKLRGKHRSRPMDDIVNEAQALADRGVKELILIAQDTGEYGIDLYGQRSLSVLLRKLNDIPSVHWIRLLYVYPETIDDALIETMKNCEKVVPYIDIPLQHINDRILKAMGRHTDEASIHALIKKLRDEIPQIVIRSTFITGFPGETEEEHRQLVFFLREAALEKVGVFRYSQEEGTPAAEMGDQVPEKVKQRRYDELMSVQESISEHVLERFLDCELDVIAEEQVDETTYVGRSQYDAPDIDGVTYLYTDHPLTLGEFYRTLITDSMEYDLIGQVVGTLQQKK